MQTDDQCKELQQYRTELEQENQQLRTELYRLRRELAFNLSREQVMELDLYNGCGKEQIKYVLTHSSYHIQERSAEIQFQDNPKRLILLGQSDCEVKNDTIEFYTFYYSILQTEEFEENPKIFATNLITQLILQTIFINNNEEKHLSKAYYNLQGHYIFINKIITIPQKIQGSSFNPINTSINEHAQNTSFSSYFVSPRQVAQARQLSRIKKKNEFNNSKITDTDPETYREVIKELSIQLQIFILENRKLQDKINVLEEEHNDSFQIVNTQNQMLQCSNFNLQEKINNLFSEIQQIQLQLEQKDQKFKEARENNQLQNHSSEK